MNILWFVPECVPSPMAEGILSNTARALCILRHVAQEGQGKLMQLNRHGKGIDISGHKARVN